MNAEDLKVAVLVGELRTPLDEGTGKSAVNLAKKLDEKLDEAFVFTRDSNSKEDNLPREEIYEGVRIVRRPIKATNFFQNRQLMREEGVDLVHVHTSSAKMALYASKLTSNSLWTIPAYRSSSKEEKLWRLLSRQKVVATSNEIRERSPAEDVIPYGIDTENYNIREKPGKNEDLDVLYMGAPNEKRGFLSAIKTVKNLREKKPVNLLVAVRERNNQKERAREKIMEEGLEDITEVRGFIEDLPEFYNSADILLNPIKDSSGVTSPPIITLEAMSCGRIVCCTEIPDFRELIEDGKNGLLFRYGEEKELAERICQLEQQEFDTMSEKARETIESNYSWDYITEKYIEEYRGVIDGS